MSGRTRVLFVCTHNSARSQMAEGLLRALYGDRYESYSAGTEATVVNPNAVSVMAEAGVDISGQRAKMVDELWGQQFDYVVTLCDSAKETCPFFPGTRILHQSFDDPAAVSGSEEEILQAFRRCRDEIRRWIETTFGPRAR